jgi:phenylpropionate dioxygenase-like ring-hydroxylating dioxygenase large terminal subunit
MASGFIRNAWYMAGWAHELDQGKIARRIIDVPVVVIRSAEGAPYALHDRCPHRFAPLSRGRVTERGIECGYHGLTFDRDGTLVANPLTGVLPAACRVRSLPVHIQDNVVWIWMGDAEKLDVASIPRFACFENPNYRFVYGVIDAKANYQLLTDNLLDLTHAAFLHPSFGGLSYRPKASMTQQGETVYAHYLVKDIPNPDFPEIFWSSHGKNVDLWDDIRWNAPAAMYLESGVVLAGRPREEGYIVPAVHVQTPVTAARTTYFWASALPADSSLQDDEYQAFMSKAFATEDLPMIESIEDRMEGSPLWDLEPVMLREDAAAVIARRIVDTRIKAEAAAVESAG